MDRRKTDRQMELAILRDSREKLYEEIMSKERDMLRDPTERGKREIAGLLDLYRNNTREILRLQTKIDESRKVGGDDRKAEIDAKIKQLQHEIYLLQKEREGLD